MTPVVFINCKEQPFVDQIICGRKWYETRTRNTLGGLTNRRVFLAETGHGVPVVKCSAVLHDAVEVRTERQWNFYFKPLTCIPVGSKYDWKPDTKVKYCYYLSDVEPVKPWFVPDGKRHGRVWREVEE